MILNSRNNVYINLVLKTVRVYYIIKKNSFDNTLNVQDDFKNNYINRHVLDDNNNIQTTRIAIRISIKICIAYCR